MVDNKRTVYWTAGQPPVDIDEKDILNELTAEDYYEIKRTGTVTLPNNIRYIPPRFFINMKNLKYIKLPESLEYIGDFAFRNTSLQKVVFPTSLKGIGYGVFAESNIEDADLSHTNLTYLGGNAFDDCDKLKNVILPDSLEILKEHVFSYTSALTHIKLSNNLKTIDTSCFYNSSIENIDLPASLKILATRAFAYCSNLTSVIVPEGVERIEGAVFKSCNNLHEIFLPSTLTYLDNNAIIDCINLKYLFYNGPKENLISALWDPKTLISNLEAKKVQIIPYSTPASISFLDDIILDEKLQLNENNYDKNGLIIQNDEIISCRRDITTVVIPNNVKSIGDYAFYYCGNLTSVTIPNSVTSIGSHAFVGCKNITNVTIPNSVTSIGGSAFFWCVNLTSITIPNSVTSIEECTFYACNNLTNIELPDNLTSIGSQAFFYCSSLTSIELPDSVTYIGEGAFGHCDNLKDIYYSGSKSDWEEIEIEEGNEIDLLAATIHYENSKYNWLDNMILDENKKLTEKNNIREAFDVYDHDYDDEGLYIEDDALISCSGLVTDVSIPNTVTIIESEAFYSCLRLTNVTIPNSVKTICEEAFFRCLSLSTITIPDSVTNIKSYAFCECFDLKTVTIGIGLKTIESGAFWDCEKLTDVYYAGTRSDWEKIKIGEYNDFLLEATIHYNNDYSWLDDMILDESLIESKQDELNFKNWLNNDQYADLFIKFRQGFKQPENNYYYWIKKKQPEDLIKFIDNYQRQKAAKEKEHQEVMDGAEFLGEDKGYKVYHITTWKASKTLGQGAKWCISMKNKSTYWKDYTSSGVKFYFFISSQTKYALALYPEIREVNEVIDDTTYLVKSNFEIYNAEDNLDYLVVNQLPLNLINEQIILEKEDAENGLAIKNNKLIQVKKDIKNIIIPSNVTSIWDYAFLRCGSLTSIIVDENNAVYDSRNNCNAIIETSTNSLIVGCKNTVIPNSVTSIGERAFYECSSLTNIEIPNSVTRIGDYAFFGCSSLTSIEIPNSVTSIGYSAFSGCTSLTSITIPDSVTSIGNSAFSKCSSLTNIKLPNGLTSIEWYAFHGCSSLTNITIPDSVTSIGGHAFDGCINLTNITIPDSVTSIGNSAFSYCKGLTSITIPNSVASIEKYTFSGCSNLKNVYFQGTEKQWNKIKIDKDYNSNRELLNATIHFNSKNESLIESNESLNEKIVKKDNQYQVQSEKGRNMGTYKTKKEAEKRLQQVEYFKHLNEKVEKHDTLNPKLFDENNHLKKEVRDKVLDIVDEFVSGLQEDGVKINIKDIIIVGSNASYNYNDQSDIDVHIKVDTKSLDCPDNLYPLLYSAYRSIFNKKFDIDFYGIPVELYVETIDEEPEVVEDEKE